MMTPQEFQKEKARRIAISEGTRLYKYLDSRQVKTIGTGFNLERGDARQAIEQCGGDWATVQNGPVAIDSNQVNAVAEVITAEVADALLQYTLRPIESEARASLPDGIYDALNDPRRFVINDLVFNMGSGEDGWGGFHRTQEAIAEAQRAKDAGAANAHDLFVEAASMLAQSAWYSQVGARAMRDVAMLREGVWCEATGDGSDI